MLKVKTPPALVPAEKLEEAKGLSASLLADAMAGFGAMDYRIKPITAGMKVVGTAFTVNPKAGTALPVIAAVALAGEGHILVISGKGDLSNVVLGEIMTLIAQKRAVSGIVVDGLVRDVAAIRATGMPVFAIGALPAAAEKEGPGEINGPVSCGGIAVNPGDLIVGDDDGVVVVPRDNVDGVLATAKAKAAAEAQRIRDIGNGVLMPEWLKKRIAELEQEK